MKKRILYVEDMEECYTKTCVAIGKDYQLDWRRNVLEAMEAIDNLESYDMAILDVNLDYDSLKPDDEQTLEGLNLIKILVEERKKLGKEFPILCVSSGRNKEDALKAGADEYLYKREFWGGKGKKSLEKHLE